MASTLARNFALSKAISGNRIRIGRSGLRVGRQCRRRPRSSRRDVPSLRGRTPWWRSSPCDATSKLASRTIPRRTSPTEPKPGTAVGDRQIVVHGLGHVYRLDRIAQRLGQLRHLQAGVGGIAAAVVEEVADVVRLEDLDQALVLGAVLLEALELVAARPERARRGVAQAPRWPRPIPCWCRSGPR